VKKESMICPRCRAFSFTSAILSRRDNSTKICSDCGLMEGLEASGMKAPYQGPQYWTGESRSAAAAPPKTGEPT
jgi:transcription elongation factor Elf1